VGLTAHWNANDRGGVVSEIAWCADTQHQWPRRSAACTRSCQLLFKLMHRVLLAVATLFAAGSARPARAPPLLQACGYGTSWTVASMCPRPTRTTACPHLLGQSCPIPCWQSGSAQSIYCSQLVSLPSSLNLNRYGLLSCCVCGLCLALATCCSCSC
jgi:hypothetical protein